MSRLQRILVLLAGLVVALALTVPSTADARFIGAHGGPPGTATSPGDAQCRYKPAWSTLQLNIGGPTVRTSRTINVRYALLARNAVNGAAIATVRSPYVTVRPGRPFTFGPGTIQVPWRQNVHLVTVIEFATGRAASALAFVADRYHYFNGNNAGPFGPFRSCYRS